MIVRSLVGLNIRADAGLVYVTSIVVELVVEADAPGTAFRVLEAVRLAVVFIES